MVKYCFTRFTRGGVPEVSEKLGKEEILAEVFLTLEMLLSEKDSEEGDVVGFLVRREDRLIDDNVKEELDKFFIVAEEGVCPICKEHGELLVVRGGVTACRVCMEILARTLELAKGGVSVEELDRLLGGEANGQGSR